MITTIDLGSTLLDAAKDVLQTMAGLDVKPLQNGQTYLSGQAVLGSITFQGQICGCLGIACPPVTAKAIAAGMLGLGSDQDLSESDYFDSLGELANMVMGEVKAALLSTGLDLQVSIPTVVAGQDIHAGLANGFKKVSMFVQVGPDLPVCMYLLYKTDGQA